MPTPAVHTVSSGDHLAFQITFENMGMSALAVQTGPDDWALNDTGATHHVFKDHKFFKSESFKENDVSSKRLKPAGGEVFLNVNGQGNIVLKAGDRTTFEFLNCLWVPDLSRNLVAGGILKSKGVRELYDSADSSNFSLIKGNLALFNGYIGNDNLMHLELKPVSQSTSSVTCIATNVSLSLVHRRLGHVSEQYHRQMCRHRSVEGLGVDDRVYS